MILSFTEPISLMHQIGQRSQSLSY